MDSVTIALARQAARQKSMPDTVTLPGQEMPRRFMPLCIVQAQLNGLGASGIQREIYAVIFKACSKPVRGTFQNHAVEPDRTERDREAASTISPVDFRISKFSWLELRRQRQLFNVVPGMFSRASDPRPR